MGNRHLRKPNTDDIINLNRVTPRQVDAPREYSSDRKAPRVPQPGVKPTNPARYEKGSGRG